MKRALISTAVLAAVCVLLFFAKRTDNTSSVNELNVDSSSPTLFSNLKIGTSKAKILLEEKGEKVSFSPELSELAKVIVPYEKEIQTVGYQKVTGKTPYFLGFVFNADDYLKAAMKVYAKDMDSILETREALGFALSYLTGLTSNKLDISASLKRPQNIEGQLTDEEKIEEFTTQLRVYFNEKNVDYFMETLNRISQYYPLYQVNISCQHEDIKATRRVVFVINQGIDKLNVQVINLFF